MNCPNCGNATQQAPNGSWYCGNCGWSSGYAPDPAAVAWLEQRPVNAFVSGGSLETSAAFNELGRSRGGGFGLYSMKADHEMAGGHATDVDPYDACLMCRSAARAGVLVVIG